MRVAIYQHCWLGGPRWEELWTYQLDRIVHHGLYAKCDYIAIGVYGDFQQVADLVTTCAHWKKIEVNCMRQQGGEQDTLRLLWQDAATRQFDAALYCHLKGVKYPEPYPQVEDWRELMEHFTIDRWQDALGLLRDGFDTVGVNLQTHPEPRGQHYGGNFFWITAEHARRLPDPTQSETHQTVENWPFRVKHRPLSLHDSHVDHYQELYPRERYQ